MSIIFNESTSSTPFINGFSVRFDTKNIQKCAIVTVLAKTNNDLTANIRFKTVAPDGSALYISPDYLLQKEEKQFRLPPALFKNVYYVAEFLFNAQTEFNLIRLDIEAENELPKHNFPLFDGHLGLFAAAPENTIHSFEMAGMCGFNGCITIPKLTKDGVFVCIHDDTINRTGRNRDGSPISNETFVKDLTYKELLNFDFGIHKHPLFKGTQIPLLEEYFAICKKYSMAPIFSVHPDFCDKEWAKITEMLKKYGLLSDFKFKSKEISVLKHGFDVFGNEIGGYIFWEYEFKDKFINDLKEISVDTSKCNVIVEIANRLGTDNITKEIVEKIKKAGFNASCLACWERKNGDYFKKMFDLGIEEFNEDYHCSFGLNW